MKQDDNAMSIVSVLHIFFALIKKSRSRTIQGASKKYPLHESKVYFTFLLWLLMFSIEIFVRLTDKQNRKHFKNFCLQIFFFNLKFINLLTTNINI